MKAVQPRKPFLTAEAYAKVAEAIEVASSLDPSTLHSLILDWRAAPEWKRLADGTRRVWGGHLDLIEANEAISLSRCGPITVWLPRS